MFFRKRTGVQKWCQNAIRCCALMGTVNNDPSKSCYSRSTQHTINNITQRHFLYWHEKAVVLWLQKSTGTKPNFQTKQNEYRIFLHHALNEVTCSQNPILINDLFHRVHRPNGPYIGVNAVPADADSPVFCASRKKYFLGSVSNLLQISSFFEHVSSASSLLV